MLSVPHVTIATLEEGQHSTIKHHRNTERLLLYNLDGHDQLPSQGL